MQRRHVRGNAWRDIVCVLCCRVVLITNGLSGVRARARGLICLRLRRDVSDPMLLELLLKCRGLDGVHAVPEWPILVAGLDLVLLLLVLMLLLQLQQ